MLGSVILLNLAQWFPSCQGSFLHVFEGFCFRGNVLHRVRKVVWHKSPLIGKAERLEDLTCHGLNKRSSGPLCIDFLVRMIP